MKKLTTKIIAGKYRGKTISLADITVTRSTKSIMREAVFNTLQGEVADAYFVEVFGGSGTMGIEAISRGATQAYFLEKDRNSFFCIKQNLDALDIENARVHNVDSFEFFGELLDMLPTSKKRIFYFDPPFNIRENMENIYERCFTLIEKITPNMWDIVVIEHITDYDIPDAIGKFALAKRKKFGKSSVSYYLPQS
jgi:16S rRNA (guanine966-N2)-methyltransferase